MEDRRTEFPAFPGRRVSTTEVVERSYCLKEIGGSTLERAPVRCSVRSTPDDHRVYRSKVVPVYAVKAYRGTRSVAPLIRNSGTRWRWVVNFTSWPLDPRRKGSYYPPLGWSQSYSGRGGGQNSLLPTSDPSDVHSIVSHCYCLTLCILIKIQIYFLSNVDTFLSYDTEPHLRQECSK